MESLVPARQIGSLDCDLRFDADHGEFWNAAGLRGVRYAFEAAKAYVRGETPRTDDTHGRARL